MSCRGRNRTRGRRINSALSVPTHKPYKIGRGSLESGSAPAVHGRPPRTNGTPSRRFELSENRRHTTAFGALAGNRTLSDGLRTRCSTNELQAQIHASSESGENRTLAAQGKNLARYRYATDSVLVNLIFDCECHS
jgi:hypothetical protein